MDNTENLDPKENMLEASNAPRAFQLPRLYAQRDFLLCTASLSLAVASGVCKNIFFANNGSLLNKLLYLVPAVFGLLALRYAQKTVTFYRNFRYLVAYPLMPDLETLKHGFEEAYQKAAKVCPLEIIGTTFKKDAITADEKKLYCLANLSPTKGHMPLLLKVAKESPYTSPLGLLDQCHAKINEIFYNQLLETALLCTNIQKRYWTKQSQTPQIVAYCSKLDQLLARLEKEIPLATRAKGNFFYASSSIEEYMSHFDQFFQNASYTSSFQGRVLLDMSPFTEGLPFTHEIFIQCNGNSYRFYDPMVGFFVFPSKRICLETLRALLCMDRKNELFIQFTQ